MKINKQSNVYTIAYIIVAVIVVGAALAFTAMSLRDKQQANADADKMKQILRSVRVEVPQADLAATFDSMITSQLIVNSKGQVVATAAKGDASVFSTDIAAQSKLPADERRLPVFMCRLDDGAVKYILPVYGAGLWGPIWGYVAIDADGSEIYGAYFSHASETPGLGAEIEKPFFQERFEGKQIVKDGRFIPVEIVKAGQRPADPDADYVDGISGGTITSKGVGAMLDNCLRPYAAYLETLACDK